MVSIFCPEYYFKITSAKRAHPTPRYNDIRFCECQNGYWVDQCVGNPGITQSTESFVARIEFRHVWPKTYDRDLSRLFSADPRHHRSKPASSLIRRHRAQIRQLVARWTGENQLTLDAVLDDMISRCRELDLRAVGAEHKLVLDFTVLVTAKTMHALFGPSRRKWIAL